MQNTRDGNVAFKVTYTDSNWSGVCSPELAAKNFIGKEWCRVQSGIEFNCQHSVFSDPDVLNKEFAPCYDCIAQKELVFYAGHFHSERKDNEPKTALDIQLGKIALFTSKERGADESQRFIFAIGQISEVETVQELNGDYPRYFCDKNTAIIFKKNRPLFWKYYTNKNAPTRAAWNSMLFRYLDDDLVREVLLDIAKTKRYPGKYRGKAENLLNHLS